MEDETFIFLEIRVIDDGFKDRPQDFNFLIASLKYGISIIHFQFQMNLDYLQKLKPPKSEITHFHIY